MKKRIVFFLVLAGLLVVPAITLAGTGAINTGGVFVGNTELGSRDIREITINLVKVVLGFLAIVATIIVLYGGFKWMTAAGNEEKVSEARKLLVAGVIGLIIILSAFAIVTFVIERAINVSV